MNGRKTKQIRKKSLMLLIDWVKTLVPEEAAKKTIAFIREQARWDRITNRIEGAVESGKLTREEAIAKYAELKESKPKVNKQGSKRAEAYLQEVSTKLKAAVESGEITEAQAEERMESAKKQVATRLGSGKDNTNARVEAYLKKVGEEVRVDIRRDSGGGRIAVLVRNVGVCKCFGAENCGTRTL